MLARLRGVISWKPFLPNHNNHRFTTKRLTTAPPPRSKVYDFRSSTSNNKQWSAVSDSYYGGKSVAKYERTKEGNGRFSGSISLYNPNPGRIKKLGFSAYNSAPIFPQLDASAFDAFRLKVKSDGRVWIFNVKTKSNPPQCIHQIPWRSKPGEWDTVTLPYKNFLLSVNGETSSEWQSPTNMNTTHILHFGLLMSERVEGPYDLEVAEIEVVNLAYEQHQKRFLNDHFMHKDPVRDDNHDPYLNYPPHRHPEFKNYVATYLAEHKNTQTQWPTTPQNTLHDYIIVGAEMEQNDEVSKKAKENVAPFISKSERKYFYDDAEDAIEIDEKKATSSTSSTSIPTETISSTPATAK